MDLDTKYNFSQRLRERIVNKKLDIYKSSLKQ